MATWTVPLRYSKPRTQMQCGHCNNTHLVRSVDLVHQKHDDAGGGAPTSHRLKSCRCHYHRPFSVFPPCRGESAASFAMSPQINIPVRLITFMCLWAWLYVQVQIKQWNTIDCSLITCNLWHGMGLPAYSPAITPGIPTSTSYCICSSSSCAITHRRIFSTHVVDGQIKGLSKHPHKRITDRSMAKGLSLSAWPNDDIKKTINIHRCQQKFVRVHRMIMRLEQKIELQPVVFQLETEANTVVSKERSCCARSWCIRAESEWMRSKMIRFPQRLLERTPTESLLSHACVQVCMMMIAPSWFTGVQLSTFIAPHNKSSFCSTPSFNKLTRTHSDIRKMNETEVLRLHHNFAIQFLPSYECITC